MRRSSLELLTGQEADGKRRRLIEGKRFPKIPSNGKQNIWQVQERPPRLTRSHLKMLCELPAHHLRTTAGRSEANHWRSDCRLVNMPSVDQITLMLHALGSTPKVHSHPCSGRRQSFSLVR